MSTAIRIDDGIVHDAQLFGKLSNRSVPQQIEFWARIGKTAEENPDMSYEEIREILFSLEEVNIGDVEEFKFSS